MKYVVVLLFSILLSFSVAQAGETQTLRIHGSHTLGAKLVPKLVTAWLQRKAFSILETQHFGEGQTRIEALNVTGEEVVVSIQARGSKTAFSELAKGLASIGMTSRAITTKELTTYRALGQLNQANSEHVIALDGVAIIVHPKNPLNSLDSSVLAKIFKGEITNWSEVGQRPGKIQIYARDKNSGTHDTIADLVLGRNSSLAATARRFSSSAKLSAAIIKDRHGIGYVSLAYVDKAKILAVSEPGVKPLIPTPFNIATEDYLLARRLYLYLPEKPVNTLALDFIGFVNSSDSQPIIEASGFISQGIKSSRQQVSKSAPEEYRKLTKSAERLSLDIRFNESYVNLDNKAIHDVERLVAYMSRPENSQRKLMLFGFTDPQESLPYVSLTISIERADAVADYLIKSGLAPAIVRGYGQALPIASNDTEHSRHLNRRVELWID